MAENVLDRENKMGTEKMSRLVIVTGAPLMVSLLINSLYNFVDSVFVSRVSEQALTALSLAWPVQLCSTTNTASRACTSRYSFCARLWASATPSA